MASQLDQNSSTPQSVDSILTATPHTAMAEAMVGAGPSSVAVGENVQVFNYFVGHVNVHQASGDAGEEPAAHDEGQLFPGSEPRFRNARAISGLDFGFKPLNRFSSAAKHEDANRSYIAFIQTSSTLGELRRGLTKKRYKHTTFLFNDAATYEQAAQTWPKTLPLREVKNLIYGLAEHNIEFSRDKIPREHFSIYLYGVKKFGTTLSPNLLKALHEIFWWAHHTEEDLHSGPSFLQGLQVVTGIVGLGVNLGMHLLTG